MTGLLDLPSPEVLAALPADGGDEFNRLIFESSPYLLQHARNPVDWYPWCDEAFERARALDRPVFLSIGYAACHWCHVMERESFQDPDVAALLNERFVCVKVDREERPDVDHVYMTVAQLSTGSGGWPLTAVLTPDREPFFVATYIPRDGVAGRPGMVELLPALAESWHTERDAIARSTERVAAALRALDAGAGGERPDLADLERAVAALWRTYDERHGGFGPPPRFPSPHQLTMLLRFHRRTGDHRALEMALGTLDGIRAGGVYDQVGLGVHRYSTDDRWLVPHFEKMLYDQAMLSLAALDAYQVTGEPRFAAMAREVFSYVLRDLASPAGAFHSAEDADSGGEEGRFYLWSVEEVRRLLKPGDADLVLAAFGMERGGAAAAVGAPGLHILHRPRPLAAIARERGLDPDAARARLEAARLVMLASRDDRERPLLDDKILTDWNGLMIAALARGARVLDDGRYLEAARRAAAFALDELRDDEGRLLKRSRAGTAGLDALLDDHAFLVWGLIELYGATFDTRYLREALAIDDQMLRRFSSPDGGLFLTADDGERLLARGRDGADGAIPAGSSVAAWNLLRLARLTGDPSLERRAEEVLRSVAAPLHRVPEGHAALLWTVDALTGDGGAEVVIVGSPDDADTRAMVDALRRPFLPDVAVLLRPPDDDGGELATLAPFTAGQRQVGGRATAYVCRGHACQAPTTDAAEMLRSLGVR